MRRLRELGYTNLLLRTRAELDLCNQAAVEAFFAAERPEYVFLAAAKVGGILANSTYPADFMRDNLQIQVNVIESAHRHGVAKLCFLGSSCIYPKLAPQPMREEYLLTGPLEPTNEWYAIAKIAGIKLCQAYRRQYGFSAISLLPTNLYGPGDNFSLQNSHVLPALIRRFHEAKRAGRRGTGGVGHGHAAPGVPARRRPGRCLRVPDAQLRRRRADQRRRGRGPEHRRAGRAGGPGGGFPGPAGLRCFQAGRHPPQAARTPDRINELGWRPRIPLEAGVAATYRWFLDHRTGLRD